MESVMDLWRLVEEPSREIQDSAHTMTPSGDAPEHSSKSPIFCSRCDGNDKVSSPNIWCNAIPKVKDNWMDGVKFDQCKGPELEVNTPEETRELNDVPPAEMFDGKPKEGVTGSNEVIGNVPTSLTLGSEEAISQRQKRREALFQIERLLLRARPYDSIGFFYVQRELFHYLELGEFQDSSSFTRLH